MASKLGYRAVLQAAICVASLSAAPTFAEVGASAYISDERAGSPIPDHVTGAVTAAQAGGMTGGPHFAFASADAAAGVLKATAQSGLDGSYFLGADALSWIGEKISFSGGYGGTAYLDWSFHGDIALSGSPQVGTAFGQFHVYAGTIFGSTSDYTTLCPDQGCGAGWVVGTSIEKTGTVAIPINESGASVGASLRTSASFGNLADFGNTSKLYLRLPEGVTFTSSSGRFLENAQPIFTSPVPEPATYALLLAGLAVVGGASRQRAQRLR